MVTKSLEIKLTSDTSAVSNLLDKLTQCLESKPAYLAAQVVKRIEALRAQGDLVLMLQTGSLNMEVIMYPTPSFVYLAQAVFSNKFQELYPQG